MLKAKKAELVTPSKPKFMLSGKSGVGKTFFALNFPKPYFIDCERGASRKQYTDKLIASGGVYMGPDEGSQDFREVIAQVRELATTQHPFKSLILDSFSNLYLLEASAAEERVGADFGKDKREANRPSRQLMRWLERIDLNVVLICFQRDKWVRQGKELIMEGSTYEGPPRLDYFLDLWIEARMVGIRRFATVIKSRIDEFPVGTDIPLDYETFKKLYGAAIVEGPVKPITLATKEQIDEIQRITELLKVPEEDIEKWLTKAQAVEIEDLSHENATKLLEFLTKKLKGESK
jgi:hypothetical protein